MSSCGNITLDIRLPQKTTLREAVSLGNINADKTVYVGGVYARGYQGLGRGHQE